MVLPLAFNEEEMRKRKGKKKKKWKKEKENEITPVKKSECAYSTYIMSTYLV